MVKLIIGIVLGVVIVNSQMFLGWVCDYVNCDYLKLVMDNGGVLLVLLVMIDVMMIEWYVGMIDGLLFCGGVDVVLLMYGEEFQFKLGGVDLEWDQYEIVLICVIYVVGKLVFGICWGL